MSTHKHCTITINNSVKTIAILDSGYGGLLCFESIKEKLRNKDMQVIYLCDNKSCPYGEKSSDEIFASVKSLIDSVCMQFDITALFIACNTATAICKKRLEKIYSFKIFGLSPIIVKNDEKVVLLATKKTLETIQHKINSVGFSNLAQIIEKNLSRKKKIENVLLKEIPQIYLDSSEKVILGCSHYLLIKDVFQRVFKKEVSFIYSEKHEIKKIINHFKKENFSTQPPKVFFIFSKNDNEYILDFFDFYRNFILPHKISL